MLRSKTRKNQTRVCFVTSRLPERYKQILFFVYSNSTFSICDPWHIYEFWNIQRKCVVSTKVTNFSLLLFKILKIVQIFHIQLKVSNNICRRIFRIFHWRIWRRCYWWREWRWICWRIRRRSSWRSRGDWRWCVIRGRKDTGYFW